MTTKKTLIRTTEFRSAFVLLILCLLTMLFCPWMWKSLPDAYFPYSGQVIDRGVEHHPFFNSENDWDNYIVVEQADGSRTKKYLSDFEYAIVQKGTFVVKRKGFREIPLRPGQMDPRNCLQQMQKEKTDKCIDTPH